MEDRRRQEAVRVAENWSLLRKAKADRRPWFAQGGCWLLCKLGLLLVAWGKRLQRYGPLQAEGVR
jgi:hypothetical protein